MAEAEPILERLNKLSASAEPYWRPFHDAMRECDHFLSGDRYEDDFGLFNKDRRLIQIRGQETSDNIRHIVARATERPVSIEARPRDDDDDPDTAELAAALIDGELTNPWKGFRTKREQAIQACRERMAGAVMMDYVPDHGPFGEIFFRVVNADNLMFDPGYHPHDPLCGWMRERSREEVEYARKKYKAPWLTSDREQRSKSGVKQGMPLMGGGSTMAGSYDDDKVTIDRWWFKNDRTLMGARKTLGEDVLDPGDRFMVCRQIDPATGEQAIDPETGLPASCGYRSETQDQLKAQNLISEALPESLDFCPQCEERGQQGTLKRVDAKAEDADVLAFKKGRRYVVNAPFCPNPSNKPLHDGSWPIPRARSFPIYWITAYIAGDATKPMGTCDTILMWDQQVAADNLRTQWCDQTFSHRDYWGIPAVGLYDPTTMQRWEARDDQHNIFIIDQEKATNGELRVEHINGTGLDPEAGFIWSVINQTLIGYRGIYDQGPVEDRTAKSGVALKTENAIGEIPVEHFKRREAEELGMFAGVVYDYVAATYTPKRMNRLNISGTDMLLALWGDDLPNYDFVIGDDMPWAGIMKEAQEGFDQGIQYAMQYGPDALEAWAQFHGVPRSVVRKINKAFAAMQAAQQPQQPADPNQPPAGPPVAPPDAVSEDTAVPPEAEMLDLAGMGMGGLE